MHDVTDSVLDSTGGLASRKFLENFCMTVDVLGTTILGFYLHLAEVLRKKAA